MPDSLKLRRLVGRAQRVWLERRMRGIRARLDFDPLDGILIFGEPRGGSTWLAEVLRRQTRTAVVWEPFTGDARNPFKRLGIHWRQNLPDDAEWPELEDRFRDLLRGRLLDARTAYFERLRPSGYLRAGRLIFKFVHANGMLPWIARHFAFRHPPVYLLRHPFAVVASQKRHGAWKNMKLPFRVPEGPFDEAFRKHAPFLSQLDTFEEAMTANWCLSNHRPLRQAPDGRWATLFYEHLREDPPFIRELFRHFDLPVPADSEEVAAKPSRTTRGSGPAPLDAWTHDLPSALQDRMQRVLDYFEVTAYSKRSPLPHKVVEKTR